MIKATLITIKTPKNPKASFLFLRFDILTKKKDSIPLRGDRPFKKEKPAYFIQTNKSNLVYQRALIVIVN